MPIIVKRPEAGIYHADWQRNVTTDEVDRAIHELSDMATEHHDSRLVCIVDLTNCTNIPFDLQNLRRIAEFDDRMDSFVVVQATTIAQVMGNMLDTISRRNFKFAATLDEAIELSRELLDANQSRPMS